MNAYSVAAALVLCVARRQDENFKRSYTIAEIFLQLFDVSVLFYLK